MSSYSSRDHRRRFPERYIEPKIEILETEPAPTLIEEICCVIICSSIGPVGTILGTVFRKQLINGYKKLLKY